MCSILFFRSPHVLGIQGSQGSGKSTFAAFIKSILSNQLGLRVELVSIDDFYLDRKQRELLAQNVHPLFATRGVPGTHDIQYLKDVLHAHKKNTSFTLPRFDKSTDNPAPKSEWLSVEVAPDILILEGWCVGIPPQLDAELNQSINELERDDDNQETWRRYVNTQLAGSYADTFSMIDSLVVLQAPSFDCISQWRSLQETKLRDKLILNGQDLNATMDEQALSRFIQHYQRLTEHGLKLMPTIANYVIELDAQHRFVNLIEKNQ